MLCIMHSYDYNNAVDHAQFPTCRSMALHLEIQNGVLCKGQDGGRWADGRQELSRATGPNIVKVQERRTERGARGFSDSM